MVAALPTVLALHVKFRAAEPQLLPPFLGAALHGVLGRSMSRLVCIFPRRNDCRGCPLLARCTYPTLFETPAGGDEILREAGVRDQAPRPLVLAPEAGWTRADGKPVAVEEGAEVPVRITLVGRAIPELPLLVVALQRAARCGIGVRPDQDVDGEVRRARLTLATVTCGDHVVYDGASDAYAAPPAAGPRVYDDLRSNTARLELISPLRLKVEGHIAAEITPQAFIAALGRRANALSMLFGDGAPCVDESELGKLASQVTLASSELHRTTVRRYSSRQKRRMQWPGLMGKMAWRGPTLSSLWPLLRFGELVQIGKATTFGFGRYRLVPVG